MHLSRVFHGFTFFLLIFFALRLFLLNKSLELFNIVLLLLLRTVGVRDRKEDAGHNLERVILSALAWKQRLARLHSLLVYFVLALVQLLDLVQKRAYDVDVVHGVYAFLRLLLQKELPS